jgi:hypothetical protein
MMLETGDHDLTTGADVGPPRRRHQIQPSVVPPVKAAAEVAKPIS